MNNKSQQSAAHVLPPMVLLVDGEPATLHTHSRYLEAHGLWVTTATNPKSGLSYAHELLPNLLVTAMSFAEQTTGADLVHAVKQDRRTSHIPVIMLSGTPLEGLPTEARREPDVVLRQPVLPEVLYRRGRRLMAASATLSRRSKVAVQRAYLLLNQNLTARERGREFLEKLRNRLRACPNCGSALEWLDRRTVMGTEHDYYRPCVNGCGAYCFDRRARLWVTLTG